jgi:hypothetical protein
MQARRWVVRYATLVAVPVVAVLLYTSSSFGASKGSYLTSGAKGGRSGVSVRMHLQGNAFNLERISLPEICHGPTHSFSDAFTFAEGAGSRLVGKLSRSGTFSASFNSPAGTLKVHGVVKNGKARITSSESTRFVGKDSPVAYACRGSHNFTAVHH